MTMARKPAIKMITKAGLSGNTIIKKAVRNPLSLVLRNKPVSRIGASLEEFSRNG
jgi:hypothetical protein